MLCFCLKRKSNVCQFNMVKELPALGYLYNNVCNDVTCTGMPVVLARLKLGGAMALLSLLPPPPRLFLFDLAAEIIIQTYS